MAEVVTTSDNTIYQAHSEGRSEPPDTDMLVAGYLAASRSANTYRAYASDLADFEAWGGSIPSTPEMVARYLAERAATLTPSTLQRRLAAVTAAHCDRNVDDPTKNPLVCRVMQGIKRTHGARPRQVAPLLIDDLTKIVSTLGDTPFDIRDRALLTVGFFGALRRSELAALRIENVAFDPHRMRLFIPKSKTDQTGQGREIALPRRGDMLCPLCATEAWLALRDQRAGYVFPQPSLFRGSVDCHLSGEAVALIVKRRVAQIGLDPVLYSGHSLRAGFATSAALAGIDRTLIARQMGHKSELMLGVYVRPSGPLTI